MTTAMGFADVSHLVDRQRGLQGEVLLRPRRHAQGDSKLGDDRDVGRREDRDHAVALPRHVVHPWERGADRSGGHDPSSRCAARTAATSV
jgi:hypothetical protein